MEDKVSSSEVVNSNSTVDEAVVSNALSFTIGSGFRLIASGGNNYVMVFDNGSFCSLNPYSPSGLKVMDKYTIGEHMGDDCFEGTDEVTSEKMAIKVVSSSDFFELSQEVNIYHQLHHTEDINRVGFVKPLWNGQVGRFRALVTPMLGFTLLSHFEEYGKFSLNTVAKLGLQMLHRLRTLHSVGYVYRSYKMEHFLMGVGDASGICHLIDFGKCNYTAHQFIRNCEDDTSGDSFCFGGRSKFASIFVHKGRNSHVWDDIEAICYMLVEFLVGSLPWSSFPFDSYRDKWKMTHDMKVQLSNEKTCAGVPDSLMQVLCSSVSRVNEVDYEYIASVFNGLIVEGGMETFPVDLELNWPDSSAN
jgi:serine/threonine protein kinase